MAEMVGIPDSYVTVTDLAGELGVDRCSVHRLIKREALAVDRAYVKAGTGRQRCVVIPPPSASYIRKWFRKDQ